MVFTVRFEWDLEKANSNQKKHGVSFAEATSVFLREESQMYFDPEHSDDEYRFITMGYSLRSRILVVSHCSRDSEATIRIISARFATRREQAAFHSQRSR